MNTSSHPTAAPVLTTRPVPFLRSLFSLQALSHGDKPDFAIYRKTAQEIEKWMQQNTREGQLHSFLLRQGEKEWRVYDSNAKLLGVTDSITERATPASEEFIEIDRHAMTQEARDYLGIPSLALLACWEEHAGASSADHSNFAVLVKRMIIESEPTDLQHVYIVGHKKWPCRVMAMYADFPSLSLAKQDVYLERFNWLSKSWPMIREHFIEIMADRLVRHRSNYVTDLLADCGRSAGLSPDTILSLQSKWTHATPEARYRFAQHLIKTLYEGFRFTKNRPETFDLDFVQSHGAVVLKDYDTILC